MDTCYIVTLKKIEMLPMATAIIYMLPLLCLLLQLLNWTILYHKLGIYSQMGNFSSFKIRFLPLLMPPLDPFCCQTSPGKKKAKGLSHVKYTQKEIQSKESYDPKETTPLCRIGSCSL